MGAERRPWPWADMRPIARLAEEVEPRLNALGFKVRFVTDYSADAFGLKTPPDVEVTAAFSLAALYLTGQGAGFEFLRVMLNREAINK